MQHSLENSVMRESMNKRDINTTEELHPTRFGHALGWVPDSTPPSLQHESPAAL